MYYRYLAVRRLMDTLVAVETPAEWSPELTCLWATWPHGCTGSRTGGWAPDPCRTRGRPRDTSTQTPSSASADALWGCPSWGTATS